MHRHAAAALFALIAVGLVSAAPATAGDLDSLRQEVHQLKQKMDSLEARGAAQIQGEIERYLDESTAWEGSQGGQALMGITIHASFTSVVQGTIGLDPNDRTVADGDVDLDFDFQVTDNLDLFIHLTANTGEEQSGSMITRLAALSPLPTGPGAFASSGGFPFQFSTGSSPIAGPTFGGLADGIGVNGTVPTDPGSITVYEAGIRHVVRIGDKQIHWEIGAIDPRTRFLQNAFADDENTQYINNNFDDSPAVLWMTDASGRTVLGWHMWVSFGENDQFTVNAGWFNTPGQFFNSGQFMIQLHWRGRLQGRELNVRVMGFVNEFFQDSSGDGDAGGGASLDWWATDRVGVWFRFAANGNDVNPVESDFSFGAIIKGLIGSRPDDTIGVALGFVSANKNVLIGIPQDTEVTVEFYYRYLLEDGKLQITPHLMFVNDPGGNAAPWRDDLLVILGLRVHVPF